MPLKKGKSQKALSSNIQTLVDDWQKDRKIGTSRPKTKAQAVKQAVAISLSKAFGPLKKGKKGSGKKG